MKTTVFRSAVVLSILLALASSGRGGPIPPGPFGQFIRNSAAPQTGSQFNVSSGTVRGRLEVGELQMETISAGSVTATGAFYGPGTGLTGIPLTSLELGILPAGVVASSITNTGVVPGIYGGPNNYTQIFIAADGRILSAVQGNISSGYARLGSTQTFTGTNTYTQEIVGNISGHAAATLARAEEIAVSTGILSADLATEISDRQAGDYNLGVDTTTLYNTKVAKAGDTMTGDLSLPNLSATYGVSAATGVFTSTITTPYLQGGGADFTTAVTGISLSEIEDLEDSKVFTMANKTLEWQFTNPTGGMLWNFTGAAAGHSLEIMQSGGNPGADMHGLHIQMEDPDPAGMHLVPGATTSRALLVHAFGDTLSDPARWTLYGDGAMAWGDGSAAADTNLYRDSADVLKTDDSLVVVGGVTANTYYGDGSNLTGLATDAELAAVAASTGTLTEDLATEVSDRIQADSAIAVSTGTNAADIAALEVSTAPLARYANWDTAYGWGDHAGLYLLEPATFTYVSAETDPVFTASDVAGVTSADISNWDTAYGWGDHAGLYLTAPATFTYVTAEADPVFSASEAASITGTDTSNWDTAYSWGNHAGLYLAAPATFYVVQTSDYLQAPATFQYQAPLTAGVDYLAPDGDGSGLSGVIQSTATGNYALRVATATYLATAPGACAAGEFINSLTADGTKTCAAPAGGGDVVLAATQTFTGANTFAGSVTVSSVTFTGYISGVSRSSATVLVGYFTTTQRSHLEAVPGSTLTITTNGGTYLEFGFAGAATVDTAGEIISISVGIDGVPWYSAEDGITQSYFHAVNERKNLSFTALSRTALAAGTHTVYLSFFVTGGTGTLYCNNRSLCQFWVRELR